MKNGQVAFNGGIEESLKFYLNSETCCYSDERILSHINKLKPTIKIHDILINGTDKYSSTIFSGQDVLNVKVVGYTSEAIHADLMVFFRTKDHITMATLAEGHCKGLIELYPAGEFSIEKNILLPKYLSCGDYLISLCLHHPMVEGLMDAVDCALIHIEGYQEGFGRTLQLNTEGFLGLETK